MSTIRQIYRCSIIAGLCSIEAGLQFYLSSDDGLACKLLLMVGNPSAKKVLIVEMGVDLNLWTLIW